MSYLFPREVDGKIMSAFIRAAKPAVKTVWMARFAAVNRVNSRFQFLDEDQIEN